MDRHPQQIKRERQDKVRRARNIENMSKLKTLVKSVMSETDAAKAEVHYKKAVSFIDKMAQNHLIHQNKAARQKAQITRHLNSLS